MIKKREYKGEVVSRREYLKQLGFAVTGTLLLPTLAFGSNNIQHVITKGIYAPGWQGVNSHRIDKTLRFMVKHNLNTLMIDVKDAHGDLFYKPICKLAQNIHAQTKTINGHLRSLELAYLKDQAHQLNIRLIARHVMFSDKNLYNRMPELQIPNGDKQHWVDIQNRKVIAYNLELIQQEAQMGFNEIVLDYIRFPDMQGFGTEENRCAEVDAIVKTAADTVHKRGVKLGLQVFGYSAWSHNSSNVGQRIETLQKYADVIYPMLYPSHFHKGTLGFPNPSEHPYEIIKAGYNAAMEKIATNCKIIPMIQGFSYSPEHIAEQLRAVISENMPGYICWNPSANYSRLAQAIIEFK